VNRAEQNCYRGTFPFVLELDAGTEEPFVFTPILVRGFFTATVSDDALGAASFMTILA
jgi:hypothetical protein